MKLYGTFEIYKTYFEAFSNKNLELLSELFDDNIVLEDWESIAQGKTEVLKKNQAIFDNVKTIQATPITVFGPVYKDGNSEYAVSIVIDIVDLNNNPITLNVVDILTLNTIQKIIKIKAYKG